MGLLSPQQLSTQSHLDIADIRENLVILRNGKVSMVIETTSLNFDLLADVEQNSRIGTFAGLLNSLNFPIQIVIRTQQTDTSKYLDLLDEYKQRVSSEPIKQQVEIYQTFINTLTATTQVLDKRFYAVIPTQTLLPTKKSGGLFGGKSQINLQQTLTKAMQELQPKRDHMIKQFANMGLAARQLRNDELIKLYYSIYEPGKAGLEVLNLRQDATSGALVNVDSSAPTHDSSQAVAAPEDALQKRPVRLDN